MHKECGWSRARAMHGVNCVADGDIRWRCAHTKLRGTHLQGTTDFRLLAHTSSWRTMPACLTGILRPLSVRTTRRHVPATTDHVQVDPVSDPERCDVLIITCSSWTCLPRCCYESPCWARQAVHRIKTQLGWVGRPLYLRNGVLFDLSHPAMGVRWRQN